MLRKSHQKVKPIKKSSKKTPKRSSKRSSKKTPKKTPKKSSKRSSKIKSYKFRTSLAKYPSSLSVKSPIRLKNTEYKPKDIIATGNVKEILDKIKNGEPFSKVEIDKITEMFKSFGKQIKNKKIRDAFEKVLHFLGTIEEDRSLTSKETSKMIMIWNKIYEGVKRKIGLPSHFTHQIQTRGRSRSRADIAAENEKIENRCPLCYEPYDEMEHTLKTIEECGHKLCNSCAIIMTKNGDIKCHSCRVTSKSPARGSGSAPASARGPPPARGSAPASGSGSAPAQRHQPETLAQIMAMVSALIGSWALYMIFWKIPPESLDLFGFCKTVAASTISLLIFLFLSASSSR